jgi:hypothetical protein
LRGRILEEFRDQVDGVLVGFAEHLFESLSESALMMYLSRKLPC